MGHVGAAYSKELGGRPMTISPNKRGIVERVEEALKSKGVEKFNKGRVAKRIMQDLPKKKLGDLSKDSIAGFKTVIEAINRCVAAWKKD
jgi:hypothetical protein